MWPKGLAIAVCWGSHFVLPRQGSQSLARRRCGARAAPSQVACYRLPKGPDPAPALTLQAVLAAQLLLELGQQRLPVGVEHRQVDVIVMQDQVAIPAQQGRRTSPIMPFRSNRVLWAPCPTPLRANASRRRSILFGSGLRTNGVRLAQPSPGSAWHTPTDGYPKRHSPVDAQQAAKVDPVRHAASLQRGAQVEQQLPQEAAPREVEHLRASAAAGVAAVSGSPLRAHTTAEPPPLYGAAQLRGSFPPAGAGAARGRPLQPAPCPRARAPALAPAPPHLDARPQRCVECHRPHSR